MTEGTSFQLSSINYNNITKYWNSFKSISFREMNKDKTINKLQYRFFENDNAFLTFCITISTGYFHR